MHACIDTQTTNIHTDTTLTRIYSHKHLLSFQLDIDACNGTHNCSQICTKTNGSFICDSGYLLDIDGVTCNGMQFAAFIHTYNKSNLMYIPRYNYSYNK